MANKNNNKSIDVTYVFPETISKKSGDLYSNFPGIDELTIYEEPRWSFKDHLNNEVMNYLKDNDNDLYEEIIEYQKEHPEGFYFDVGKSLRYDDCYGFRGDFSNESLDDKLDDLFFIRYSSKGLDGNLDNPDEIQIRNEKLVSKLNSMIKEHVQNNIDRYNEYKKIRSELVDKELADKFNNAIDIYYEEDILKADSCPEKTNPDNYLIRLQEGQLTTDLEVLLGLNKDGDLTHNFGWFKYAELDKNGMLVKEYPAGLWDERQDENGNALDPIEIHTHDLKEKIISVELQEKIENNFKKELNKEIERGMKESFDDAVRKGVFENFDSGEILEHLDKQNFEDMEPAGSFKAGNCEFNLYLGFSGDEPCLFISPVETVDGELINGMIALPYSKITDAISYNDLSLQIKFAIQGKLNELDSQDDVQKTLLTVFGVDWKQYTQGIISSEKKELDYTNFLDRKSLIADRKEVDDNLLDYLYELSEEDVNFDSLEKFTDKKYRDLTEQERTELINRLENADYKKYKNCYISTSKLLYEKPETLVKEIKALNVLNELGYTVYLLPYGYARNNQDFLQKSSDSLVHSQFLEMKTVVSSGKSAGQSAYKDSRKQSDNVILSYTENISPHTAMQSLWNYINGAKKDLIEKNEGYDFSGEIILHFEKENKTILYEVNKEGIFIQKNIHDFGVKKALALDESQVVGLFSDKSRPLPENNIHQKSESVNNTEERIKALLIRKRLCP